jgi:aspartate/methionine/tyrosine aminotransferase
MRPFRLERYFAQHEFSVPHLLCASDPESWRLADLLALADDECRALWADLALGYTESGGHPLLRAAIAASYENLTSDDVLVCAGGQEAIFLVMSALVGPGDHAVAVWPAYQSLYEVARAAGGDVTLVPLRHEARWALDVDEVAAAMRPNTSAIIVNFPHNPTGALPPRSTLDALVALAESSGARLVSDEVYRLLEQDGVERWPQAADVYERAVSLNVMTKAYGLGGLRIGWLATRDRAVLQAAATRKDYTTICSSAPSEILALIALRSADTLLARTRGLLARNLAAVRAFFDGHSGLYDWVPPRAGPIAFPRLLADADIDDVAATLARQEGVLLLPGSVYEHGGNHFRIGFGRADCADALERLARFSANLG